MTYYHLHVGASTLPRIGVEPLTLAQAMYLAHGQRYAVVYQLCGGVPVPLIAAAGDEEIVFVPTGRRISRDAIPWRAILTEVELWQTMLARRD